MAGWQTDKSIFTTQKIKQGLRQVLCEIAYSLSIDSSQCTFHGFIKDIFRKRNASSVVNFTSVTERTVGQSRSQSPRYPRPAVGNEGLWDKAFTGKQESCDRSNCAGVRYSHIRFYQIESLFHGKN